MIGEGEEDAQNKKANTNRMTNEEHRTKNDVEIDCSHDLATI